VFEIPSAAKAALESAACGGTKVPPLQYGDIFRDPLARNQGQGERHSIACAAKNRAGEQEEELASAGFQRVGEDPSNEGEEKRQRPEPGRADGLGGDEGREREHNQKRCGVAEVAAAAHSAIEKRATANAVRMGRFARLPAKPRLRTKLRMPARENQKRARLR